MDRILTYTVQPDEENMLLLDFLRSKGFSRGILSSMKPYKGAIQLNGKRGFGKSILHAGDFLRIHIPETENSENILPVKMNLSILYEDEDLLVVNKPADMPVHPSIGNYDNTLANGAAWYFKEKGQTFVYRCINRLDRDTTGLLILAKNALSASILSAQMKKREIHRTYQAIVKGVPIPESGTIDAPIARKEGSAIERCVDFEKGERAVTHYRVLDSRNDYSLVQLSLETGRTHQIRVHMGYLGHPLLGDYLYYPDFSRIKRVSLHSYALSFTHPMTGSPLTFRAPLPEDMADLFA